MELKVFVQDWPLGRKLALVADGSMSYTILRRKFADALHAEATAAADVQTYPADRLPLAKKRLFFRSPTSGKWLERDDDEVLPSAYPSIDIRFSDTTPPQSREASRSPPSSPGRLTVTGDEDSEEDASIKLSTIFNYLTEKGVKRIYLFGSTLSSGTTKDAHDWDIGVEGAVTLDSSTFQGWADYLTEKLGKPVQLTSFDSTTEIIRHMRHTSRRITRTGSLTIPSQAYLTYRDELDIAYGQLKVLSSTLQILEGSPKVDTHGVAKRLETFYQVLENFWTRILKFNRIKEPEGGSSHQMYIDTFSGRSSLTHPSLPLLTDEEYDVAVDLKKFRHFARHAYVVDYDQGELWKKVRNLDVLLVYVRRAILEISDRIADGGE